MRVLSPSLTPTPTPPDGSSEDFPAGLAAPLARPEPGTMKARVTQAEIARAAGVHNTTVSLALRNSQLIPPETRERIQAIARSLGYAPDPALRALAAYRNARRGQRRVETLVYLTSGETGGDWRGFSAQAKHASAVRRKATDLGFQFRHVNLDEPGMSVRRLDRMLEYEGIRCVAVAAHRLSDVDRAGIDWSRLCAVGIGGAAPLAPLLNHITLDAGAIMRLALQRTRLAGYRNIGLVLTRQQDELDDRAWSAAFLAEQYRCGIRDPLPVLYLPEEPAQDDGILLRWFRACRPEAILGLSLSLPNRFRRARLRVPADVAYADLFLQDNYQTIAGVQEHCTRVGELAVEMLAAQLEQNQFGLPTIPTVTSVGGTWCEGASLPLKPLSVIEALERTAPVALQRNLVA